MAHSQRQIFPLLLLCFAQFPALLLAQPSPAELERAADAASRESAPAVQAASRGGGFTCPGGVAPLELYYTGFETGAAGWSVGGAGDWERGAVDPGVYSLCETAPSPEPTGTFAGSNVFATNLDGCYANQNPSAASTLGQAFDFSSLQPPIILEWAHWYHVFESFDRGEVFVNGVEVFRTPNAVATADWLIETADLSAFAGNPSVNVQFSLFSTTVVNRMGWYLDEVRLLTCNDLIFRNGFETP